MNFIIPNNNLQLNKPYHKIFNRHDGIYVDHPVSLMFFLTTVALQKIVRNNMYHLLLDLFLQYPSLDDHRRLNSIQRIKYFSYL